MFGAYGQTDGVGADALIRQLFGTELGVGGGGGVDDQTLHVGHIGQQGENLQAVDEPVSLSLAAPDLKGEDGRAPVGKIPLVQCVVRVVRQRGMVHTLHLGVLGQIGHHLPRVLGVALQAQGEGLHALKQQKGVEGGDGGAGVPQEDGPDVGHKGGGAGGIHKADAVIAGIGRGDGGVFVGCLPVEPAGIHDNAAQGGAVAADELGGGVDYHVGAVLNGPDEIGGAEGVVDDQRQAVPVGERCDGVDVGDIAVGVAQGLQIDGPGIGTDGGLQRRQIVGVHKGSRYAELG